MLNLLAWPPWQNRLYVMVLQRVLINTVNGDVQTVIHSGTTTVRTDSLVLSRVRGDILIMTGIVTLAVEEEMLIMAVTMNTAPMVVAPIQILVTVTAALPAEIRAKSEVQVAENHDHHVQTPLFEAPDLHQEIVALQVVVSNRIIIKDKIL